MSEQTQPRRSGSLFRRRSRSSSVASSVKNGSSPYQQEDLPPVPPMPDNANEKAKKKFGPIPVPRFGISRTSSKQSTVNNDRVHKEDVKEGFKRDEQHAKVHSFDPNESTSQKEAELKETQKSTTEGVEGDNLPKPPTKDEEQPEAVPEASIVPPKQQKTTPAQTTAQKGEEAFKSAPIYAIDDIPGYMSHKDDNLPSTTLPKWYMRSKELPDSLGAQSFDIATADDDGGSTLLPEKFYGQWFHNAAVVLVSSLFTYTLAYFNFGIGPLAVVGIASVTYYNISISKVDKDVKDGISRQLMKPALESESESADWVNNFLMNFWTHLEPYICEQVITNVEPIIAQYKPGFIKSVRLAHLTLGSKAPRILSVRTWPSTADNIITMDWKVAFTPANLGPLGEGQTDGIVNPKIIVQVVVGNGKFTTTLPVILEDFSFLGNMRVKLTLINDFPHVKLVDLSFIEKPELDYIAKPIGGENFGLDVNYIPGLTTFIREQVYGIMQPMMFDPNVFTLNLQEILAGGALDSACGVLVITIRQARGLRSSKIGSGAPDPYTTITVGNSKTINDRTKTLSSTDNPVWMETKHLLVNSLNDQLVLNVYDYNEVRKDSDIGLATINLQSLANDPVQELVIAKLLNGGKERGDIRFDLNYYPVMEPPKEGESLEAVPDLPTGVVRLYVHEAKDLDTSKSKLGRINPAASVFVKGKQVQQTNMVRHTKSPVWDSHSEFLATNKDKTKMQVKIYHAHNFKPSMPLATVNVDLSDLLDADEKEGKWYNLGKTSGQVRLSASFKSVAMDGALDGVGQYTPPIGLIRIFCKCAHDLKNVEAAFGGKSDPYVKAILGGKVYGRTNVIDDNLSPIWNEHLYIPIHSLRDVIYLEAVDYQNLTKDRPLGHTTLRARDIIKENDNDEERKNMPYIATGINRRTSPMKLDKGGYKGELEYQAEFIPAWKIKGSTFENEEEKKEEEAKIAEEKKEEEKNKEENGTENVSGEEEEEEEEESAGLELTEDELLERESGILVVNCESGELAHKNSRLEFLLDDAIWPTFSTEKARSKKANWNHIGEGLIRELSFSQLRIRLNTGEQDENDQVYAETSMDVREFLYRTLNKEAEFTLSNDEGDSESKLKLSSRYVPVEIELSLRESVNNQGNLRVEVHNAKGLASADRNGKSDPYAVFLLEGERVHKTETKKKTLNPEWDEYFEVEVPNRVDGNFMIEVYDWDRMSAADLLGVAKVDLTAFEPLESTEFTYDLKDGESGDQGNIKVSFMFKPSFIVKTRSRTSTFSHAGRALTQVGGIGIGAGKGVVHGAGHIGKGAMSGAGFIGSNVGGAVGKAGGLFHIGKKKSPSMGGNESFVDEGSSAPRANNAQMSDKPASRVEVGDLNVTVVKAWDIKGEGHHEQPKPKPVLRMGRYKVEGKSVGKTSEPSFDESFILHTKPEKPSFSIEIVDKHLFGDRQIGYNNIMIGHYIHPEKNENSAEFDLELLGAGGYVTLKLQWSPSESRPSTSSMVNDTTNDNTEADDTQSVSSKLKSSKSSRFASLGRNSVHKDR